MHIRWWGDNRVAGVRKESVEFIVGEVTVVFVVLHETRRVHVNGNHGCVAGEEGNSSEGSRVRRRPRFVQSPVRGRTKRRIG